MSTATTTSTPLSVSGTIHFVQRGRGAARQLRAGPAPVTEPGRVPRVSRLMALAIRFADLIREGVVADYAEIASLGGVTRARVTQVMNLLHLAPDIQEQLLFLPRVASGRDPVVLRDLQPITNIADWKKQRKMWSELTNHHLKPAHTD